MAQPETSIAALVPVTMTYADQRVDMALPSSVAVAELLPGMVSALGRLTSEAATQGFRVLRANGTELSQSVSLADQDVMAGTMLTLEVVGAGASDMRYDDLVEAIGTSVDASRVPWRRGDAIQLSCYSAAALFVVASLLLVFHNGDNQVAAGIVIAGGLLVALSAAALVRVPVIDGAVVMALTAPVLLGAAGYALVDGPPTQARLASAGAGLVVGAMSSLLLPQHLRATVVGPASLGIGLMAMGIQTGFFDVSEQRAAAAVMAVFAIVVLISPWIGLAQVSATRGSLAAESREHIDGAQVRSQVSHADIVVLSVRIASGLLCAAFAPLVAIDLIGALLTVCIGVAFVLGTRSLYGRHEVLSGALGGMLTLSTAGLTVAATMPDVLPWLVGLTVLIGGFVVAWNVISIKNRPWLNRLADTVHIVALMALLPLAAMVWGIV